MLVRGSSTGRRRQERCAHSSCSAPSGRKHSFEQEWCFEVAGTTLALVLSWVQGSVLLCEGQVPHSMAEPCFPRHCRHRAALRSPRQAHGTGQHFPGWQQGALASQHSRHGQPALAASSPAGSCPPQRRCSPIHAGWCRTVWDSVRWYRTPPCAPQPEQVQEGGGGSPQHQ